MFLIPFMLIFSRRRFLSILLLGLCAGVRSHVVVQGLYVKLAWYRCCVVGTVTAINVMRVLILMWDVSILKRVRECEGNCNAGVGQGRCGCFEWWYEYMGGTHGSGSVSRAGNVLEVGGVREVRGVGVVCDMCLPQGGVEGE